MTLDSHFSSNYSCSITKFSSIYFSLDRDVNDPSRFTVNYELTPISKNARETWFLQSAFCGLPVPNSHFPIFSFVATSSRFNWPAKFAIVVINLVPATKTDLPVCLVCKWGKYLLTNCCSKLNLWLSRVNIGHWTQVILIHVVVLKMFCGLIIRTFESVWSKLFKQQHPWKLSPHNVLVA